METEKQSFKGGKTSVSFTGNHGKRIRENCSKIPRSFCRFYRFLQKAENSTLVIDIGEARCYDTAKLNRFR